MRMPVICGVDFTETSSATVATAAAFTTALREPLVLAHALGEIPFLVDGSIRRHLTDAARQHLEELAGCLPRETAGQVRVEVLAGGAHRSLLALARDEHASLLVVGWRGHGEGRQGAPGGVAERCALRAPVPVLVARDPAPFQAWAAGQRALRIVVGVDPAGPSPAMTGWLGRLRMAAPCHVVAALVHDASAADPRQGRTVQGVARADPASLEAEIAREVTASVGQLPGSGSFSVVVQLGVGRVAETLVTLASAHEADLLVVGTRTRPARPWSVAAGAVHLARRAVAPVPEGERAGAPARRPAPRSDRG